MHPIDIIILLGFVAYVIWAGWSSRTIAGQSLEQYFLAGRTLNGWQAGLSMAATQFAADTPLLVTGLVAVGGIFALWRLWIYAVSFLLIGFLLAACWQRANVLTDAELVEKRYHGKPALILRSIKALYLGTFFNITVLAMVLLAASRIVEPLLTWHAWLPPQLFTPLVDLVAWVGVPVTTLSLDQTPQVWIKTADNLVSLGVVGLLTLMYSTTGGLRGVVKTDVVQLLLMLFGTACFAGLVLAQAGGIEQMLTRLSEIFNTPGAPLAPSQLLAFTPTEAKGATMVILLVFGLQWLAQINADGSGYLAQRFMACRSAADGRQAAIVFTLTQILLRSLLWLPIALGLLVLFPPDFSLPAEMYTAQREFTYVQGMVAVLPAGVKGLMFTAMLAALASTVDTHLNWGASYWTNDLYRRLWCETLRRKTPNPQNLVWIARLSNLCILSLAFVVMLNLNSIKTAWEISLLLGAGTGIPLLMRWFWWRMNVWGEILSMGLSLISVPVLLIALPEAAHDGWRLLILIGVSLFACISSAYLFAPEPRETLLGFYREIHPPGLWHPVRAMLEPGVSSRIQAPAFGKGLMQTGLTALSVFCLLVGIGSWVFHSPIPAWWPYPGLWVPVLVLLGLALSPVWLRCLAATQADPATEHHEPVSCGKPE